MQEEFARKLAAIRQQDEEKEAYISSKLYLVKKKVLVVLVPALIVSTSTSASVSAGTIIHCCFPVGGTRARAGGCGIRACRYTCGLHVRTHMAY